MGRTPAGNVVQSASFSINFHFKPKIVFLNYSHYLLQVAPQIHYGFSRLLSPTTDLDLSPYTPNLVTYISHSSQTYTTPFLFLAFSCFFLLLKCSDCVLWLKKCCLTFRSHLPNQPCSKPSLASPLSGLRHWVQPHRWLLP